MIEVHEPVQREVSAALDEYMKAVEDKRRRKQLWLLFYYDRRRPEAVNQALAASAVEAGWDYR